MSQIVRLAQLTDLEELIELGRETFEFHGINKDYSYNTEQANFEFSGMILDKDKFLIVLVVDGKVRGMLGAVLFNAICGSVLQTFEQYLFISDEYRGGLAIRKLLNAYHAWGDIVGAKQQFISSSSSHDKFQKFYALYGYTHTDRIYIRKT